MAQAGLYIGLMSGTSVDGIDAALLNISASGSELVDSWSEPLSPALRERIFAISRSRQESVHELCTLDQDLGEAFATAALSLLDSAGVSGNDVKAIGSHGQTIRHQPHRGEGARYTLQIGDANVIAERTGVLTIADFRRRDMAAGGEGAPLVPPFHADAFGALGQKRAVVNIGGIANVTLLDGCAVVAGFDCGPGNTLLDGWIARQRGATFDAGGAWAAEYDVDESLLSHLLEDEFFSRTGPRSTGPEHFNLEWLDRMLRGTEPPGVVQATLAQLTATAIYRSLTENDRDLDAVFICGGGARNTDLMRRLHRQIEPSGARLSTTDELGIKAEWVEASAFAWLAARTLAGLPGNAPVVTGASGERVLGALYAGALPS